MTDQTQAISFDDIDMDGVVAAPAYESPPSGSYIALVSMSQKLISEKRCIEISMELQEVVEIGTQHTEKPHDPGQKFNALTFIHTPDTVTYMKRDLRPFFEATGTSSVNAMVAAVQDLRCKIVVSYDKMDYIRVAYEVIG